MDFEPNAEQAQVAAMARAFAREVIAPGAAERDRTGRFPDDLIPELGRLGLLAVNVPEEAGGSAAGPVAYVLALMELAAVECGLAVTVAVTNMVGELIARNGSPDQVARCCPRLASGEWLAGSFGLSEPQAGSDVAGGLRTRAVRRPDGSWVLDGEKQWITSGDRAGVIVVWARSDPEPAGRGLTAFLVEQGTPGLSVGRPEHKMGIRSSSTVALALEECVVPASAVLGAPGDGFKIALRALDGGRIAIGAQATGTMRAALEASTRYAQERQAFGAPIAQLQAIQFMLADMATAHAAARLMTLRTAALKEAGQPFTREAAMTKLFSSEAVQRVVSQAVQIHGGYGYTDAFPVERMFRDARVQTIYEGTSEVQRLVIARSLIAG